MAYKRHYQPKPKQYYSSSVSNKSIILSLLFVAVFVVFGFLFLNALFEPEKIPATSDEVWEIIENQGYTPKDLTPTCYERDSTAYLILTKAIGFDSADIHFEFYEFNNKDSAKSLYGDAYREIINAYNSWQKKETDNQIANYSIYTLDSLGKYGVAIYVENTAIYAYSNSENKYEINKILAKIDYLQTGNNRKDLTA